LGNRVKSFILQDRKVDSTGLCGRRYESIRPDIHRSEGWFFGEWEVFEGLQGVELVRNFIKGNEKMIFNIGL
jgi:hypothetical protein